MRIKRADFEVVLNSKGLSNLFLSKFKGWNKRRVSFSYPVNAEETAIFCDRRENPSLQAPILLYIGDHLGAAKFNIACHDVEFGKLKISQGF